MTAAGQLCFHSSFNFQWLFFFSQPLSNVLLLEKLSQSISTILLFDIKKKKKIRFNYFRKNIYILASPGSHLEQRLVNICSPDFSISNERWPVVADEVTANVITFRDGDRSPRCAHHGTEEWRGGGRAGVKWSSPLIFLGAHTRLVSRCNPCMVKPYPRG